jgi:protein TonB
MAADPLQIPAAPPEWRRCAPYLLIALGVHAAALALPAGLFFDQASSPPLPAVIVRFAEPAMVAAAPPVAVPEPPAPSAPAHAKPRVRPTPARPVLAMAPAVDPRPSSFVGPAAVSALHEAKAAGEPAPSPAPPALVAARFDAAYLNNPRPAYPAASRRLGEEGKVVLKVRVAADGRALAVNLEKSSNFERLDEAACQAVARWRFTPARRGDETVESSVLVPLVFRLDD